MEAMLPGYQFIQEDLLGQFWAIPTGPVRTNTSTEPTAGDVENTNLRQQLEAQSRETRLLKQQLQQQKSS